MTKMPSRDEIIAAMEGAYDSERSRSIDCPECKGTGITVGVFHDYCTCGGGQLFPATDTTCMEAALEAMLSMLPTMGQLKDKAHHLNMINGINSGFEADKFAVELYKMLLAMREKKDA